jgi:hypothetical protein
MLANEIVIRSTAASGRATYDLARDEQRRTEKSAKSTRRAAWGMLVFAIAFAAAFAAGINEEMHLPRFASEGRRVEAKVVRRYMRKITPYLEYSFTDDGGRTHSREVMMYQEAWDALDGRPTVAVEYLPSDPEGWNRLVAGEQSGASFGGNFLFLSGGAFLALGGLAVVALLGYDLKSENGVTTITRYGRVLKSWGTPTK